MSILSNDQSGCRVHAYVFSYVDLLIRFFLQYLYDMYLQVVVKVPLLCLCLFLYFGL